MKIYTGNNGIIAFSIVSLTILPNSSNPVFRALESLVLHPEKVDEMKKESVAYVRRHYDFVQVARQYERLYLSLMERNVK